MRTLMISFGIGRSADEDGIADDAEGRRNAAYLAAFELGPAWHGGQSAVFLTTDRSIEEVSMHLLGALDDRDLLLIVEVGHIAAVRYAGTRFDEDSFDAIFPGAEEVDHHKAWKPASSDQAPRAYAVNPPTFATKLAD